MDSSPFVILSGEILRREDALLPLEERSTLFAESIYEVVRFYRGRPFRMEDHLARMRHSLQGIGLELNPVDLEIATLSQKLVERSGFSDATVYWQLGRSAAPRDFLRPLESASTVFALCYSAPPLGNEPIPRWKAITTGDLRWHRCDLKTTMLLPNVVARNAASAAGCDAAILCRGEWVTEANTANCFALYDGVLRTHPANRWILDGVTRRALVACIRAEGIPFEERALLRRELFLADEVFLCGTLTQLAAVTEIDGRPVGDGRPGELSAHLLESLRRCIARECGLDRR
jgi:D-alanine transaminase